MPGEVPYRFVIVGLLAAAYVIWSMDKVNMSICILPLSAQYSYSSSTVGLIQSSFFWGYAGTQVLGGFLATRDAKATLGFSILLWSLATMVLPQAAELDVGVVLLSRILVGLGEGCAPPAANLLVARWVGVEERSRAVSALGVGKILGSVIGLALAPLLIEGAGGWEPVFYFFGGAGVVWSLVWLIYGQNAVRPDTDRVSPETSVDSVEFWALPWAQILTYPPMLAIIGAHFCQDFGFYAMLTYLPTYLNQQWAFSVKASGFYLIAPYLLMSVGSGASGILADKLRADGMPLTDVRKLMQGVAFVGPAALLGALAADDLLGLGAELSGEGALAVISIALALSSCAYAGLYCSHQDLSVRYAGLLLGVSNTVGAISGALSGALAGRVLEEYPGNFSLALFAPAAFCYSLGLGTWLTLFRADMVDFDAMAKEASASNPADGGR